MIAREAFEAWARTHDMDLTPTPIAVYSGIYSDCNTDYAWLAWQAATDAALDEAEFVCRNLFNRAADADECAEAIRALKDAK